LKGCTPEQGIYGHVFCALARAATPVSHGKVNRGGVYWHNNGTNFVNCEELNSIDNVLMSDIAKDQKEAQRMMVQDLKWVNIYKQKKNGTRIQSHG
jgi:hypothetical protein